MTVRELQEALAQARHAGALSDEMDVYLRLPGTKTGCLMHGVNVLRLPDDTLILLLGAEPPRCLTEATN